jgi:hypothetical protein
MIELLLRRLLAYLAGITAKQWSAALLWVLNTARTYKNEEGETKRERVIAVLKGQFPDMSDGDLLTLVQLAWAWLVKTKKLVKSKSLAQP